MPMVAMAVLLVAGIVLFARCEKEENIKDTKENPSVDPSNYINSNDTSFMDITTILCPCVNSSDFIKSNDTMLLINNNQQLNQLCANTPAIDFSKQSLLLIKGVSTSGIDTIKTNFEENINATYSLSIHVIQDMTCVAQGWYKCYLVPKINSLQDISVIITYGKF